MLIEDRVKLKRKVNRKNEKEYVSYFVTFSIKYSEILSKFKELHNVLLLTESEKIEIPRVSLTIYSPYYRRKTGEKIPQYSAFIPKEIGEKLWEKGERKLKVLVEVPDLVSRSS